MLNNAEVGLQEKNWSVNNGENTGFRKKEGFNKNPCMLNNGEDGFQGKND
jgi:hypothetical protein